MVACTVDYDGCYLIDELVSCTVMDSLGIVQFAYSV